MNRTYRQVAIAAGGVLLAAVASNALRRSVTHRSSNIAQTMTVTLSSDEVLAALEDPNLLLRALDCTHDIDRSTSEDRRIVRWSDERHAERSGRLALVNAPGDRGTELHLFMRGEKYEVKDVLRRLKAQLETGEIPTGRRN